MSDAERFRDSTQIVLPADVYATVRDALDAEFMLTAIEEPSDSVRLIGSPIDIKAASDYLARHGIPVR
ncbi:VNG_1110C family protein [Haladaptatus sp. CMSO5]|uniref:VNG_1110C family protein n=1 Tax=Haladaptatus sp. CMSO5 TaxID=3120514 RepID=UPI002FCE2BFD